MIPYTNKYFILISLVKLNFANRWKLFSMHTFSKIFQYCSIEPSRTKISNQRKSNCARKRKCPPSGQRREPTDGSELKCRSYENITNMLTKKSRLNFRKYVRIKGRIYKKMNCKQHQQEHGNRERA